MNEEESRFTNPVVAVDHVRRIARETAAATGYRSAADALAEVRREYRIMPLKRSEAPPDRLATWEAVRLETRSLVPMAVGGTSERALFDERTATPADRPLSPEQADWPDPAVALQAAALRTQPTAGSSRPASPGPASEVDRTAPGR